MRTTWLHCLLSLLTVLISLIQLTRQQQAVTIRLCAPEDVYDYCLQMANAFPRSIQCVKARDKFECMNLILRDDADIINVDPEDLYLAGRIFNLEPFAMEIFEDKPYRYKSAVMIRKDSNINSLGDLKGKRSCHTGVGRTAGWNIPIGLLLTRNIIKPNCDGVLESVADFFDSSCAPGRWSNDGIVDMSLKTKYEKLCQLCQRPSLCSSNDDYAGYDGAIRCLMERGEVAFTTVEAVVQFFDRNPRYSRDDYRFLCLDGRRDAISENGCYWAVRPTNTFIIRQGRVSLREIYTRFLQTLQFRSSYRPPWLTKAFISHVNVTRIENVPSDQQTWDRYLGNYASSIEQPLPGCQRKNVTICVTSTAELSKCLDLQKVTFTRRIRPDIRCNNPGDSKQACYEAIRDKKADIIALDAEDLYNASRYYNLKPIAMERNGYSDVHGYAVAVVRYPSEITSLSGLANVTSCHSGYNTTEGWTVPVGVLVQAGLISQENCNRVQQARDFFGGSCIPGVANNQFNFTEVEKLCRLCAGDGGGRWTCDGSTREQYYGNEGAFRCLAEGKGDVAFLDHVTPLQYTDGRKYAYWARSRSISLASDDFRLLCRQGGQGYLRDFEKCHLAKIPSRFIAMSQERSSAEYLDNVNALTDIVEQLVRRSENSFKIFGVYENRSNLIFSDTATSLVAMPEETTYNAALGDYFPILENMDKQACESASTIVPSLLVIFSLLTALYTKEHLYF